MNPLCNPDPALDGRASAPALDLSIILPTRERSERLVACLRALAHQTLDAARFEVLVGVDGPDEPSARAAETVFRETRQPGRVVRCPRAGVAGVKNLLLPHARGRFLLSINDDVYAEPGFAAAHLDAQLEIASRSSKGRDHPLAGAMVLGDSPWVTPKAPDDTLFDRLLRETSMVFFYDQMPGSSAWSGAARGLEAPALIDPAKDWGFRHAWNLNLSLPTAAARGAGGFTVFPCAYGYEDVDLAWRLRRDMGMPVLFRPEAVALHDHRYTPDSYLLRELRLGYASLGFARLARGCARETFGRDIGSTESLDYARGFVERERSHAIRVLSTFRLLAEFPAHAASRAAGVPGTPGARIAPSERLLLRALYEHHLPLKRWCWRLGLLAACEGVEFEALSLRFAFGAERQIGALASTPARRISA